MVNIESAITEQIYSKICSYPTVNQKIILEKVSNWLNCSDNETIFILNGYAGTGKTTIIASLVGALEALSRPCVLLAPTGRAANVMTRYSGHAAYTIHKHIYCESTNAQYQSRFSLGYNKAVDTLYIIDEASMLSIDNNNNNNSGQIFGSGSLLDDLLEFVHMGRNCRLMIVGDNAQLPPVGSAYSPALDLEYMTKRFGKVIYATIDEVVRQEASSGILHNATTIRRMIERGEYGIPRLDLSSPDVEVVDHYEFVERVQDCYDKYGRNETIIITRSNKRANGYNQGIRQRTIFAEDIIESGDMVMVVKNNYFFTEQLESCPMAFIANGDVASIERIRSFKELYGFNFAQVELLFNDYDTTIDCNVLIESIYSDTSALTSKQSEQLLYNVEQDYLDINSRIERFKEIRKNEYYNALQIKFSYAVTCHKAQGGQWRAVFIDRCLFGDEDISMDLLRWLYTAFTRATEKVYLVGFDARFTGEIE